ncbi:hypothetical protein LCGC14_2288850 [marine sediment metagenome]|uniref:N-acetyltransferase domain-containing protein n=1 Tax=marine sediment metagenome TaxID=412755 RepID=A0A0F9DEE7_9ZZZZ
MAELVLIPYKWWMGDLTKNSVILDEFVAHPEWCTIPLGDDKLRVVASATLTAPDSLVWECWREGELVGILLLTRVVPKIDALFHFLFFDHNLVGKRLLLRRFFQWCFKDLGLRRISMEASEHQRKYIRFCRTMGFLYEGEDMPGTIGDSIKLDRTPKEVARHGSRREQAYYHKGKWLDIQLLRLLPKDVAHANKPRNDSSRSGDRVNRDRSPRGREEKHPTSGTK